MNSNIREHPPFFVVGSVRTGTTLLRLMLGHHPAICACEEMEFVASALVGVTGWPDMEHYLYELSLDRGFNLSGYEVDRDLGFPGVAHDFLAQRQKMDGRPIVGATVHNHFDELPRVWPDARYIFLNRDPRDVARSCVAMGFVGTPWRGADLWLDALNAWKRLTDTVPADRLLSLTFERLVDDPEGELTKICRFLDVEFEPAMMAIDGDTSYSRPNRNAAKSWRDSADAWEIRQIESRIGEQAIVDAGYAPSGSVVAPGPARRMFLAIAEVIARIRFRIRHYGFWLWASGMITRRLHLKRAHAALKQRLDAIDNAAMR